MIGLTYQTESLRSQLGLLKEGNGDLAGDDAEVGGIGGLEELVEGPFLFRGQVEVLLTRCDNSQ